ncbi:M14 family zinc carboxypeptidase [Pseudokineococcus lusitanus]|uniref:Zinc carboxypeptidase n=1 Tax=Pseudokineococcus lusitanus TaxID=763993 RepID=A0A3N1HMD5_9ACTN|nr:M14 family zinc carboxypeptidase [Pseudokineococcus lusitanus]ROP43674.1 zinc carboxypeptidase [Pseudokineococcus lusitanus]
MQRRPSAPSSARRRSLVAVGLGAVLALTGAPVAAGAADAPEAPVTALAAAEPVLPADAPRTGFETSGGAAWTTLEEEQSFLAAVDAASDRVGISTLATTAAGRPIQLVQIGTRQLSAREVAQRPSILVTCLQHGNEPAAREGCLEVVRDVALDTSPATQQLLRRSTVLVVPTVNPDGRAANTRANADGVDVNRDHLALETLEAQTIAALVRDYDPEMVVDVHEYGGRADVYDRDLIRLWPRNLNVDEGLRARAVELADDFIDPAVEAEGWSTGVYGIWNGPGGEPIAQVAGDGDERIMRNAVGLKHTVGQLTESQTRALTAEEQADPTVNTNRRVDTNVLALRGSLDMLRTQGAELRRETAAAEREAARLGAAGEGYIRFGGADNVLPTSSELLLDPPCAYDLTGEQLDAVSSTLSLHDIRVVERADGTARVPMGQPARGVIPLLMDERAAYDLVQATPVDCA